MFLAPAVTPWKNTDPGVGSNNPALRLYSYERSTGAVLDYQQYYMNLSSANRAGSIHWELEYQATSAYNISDVSAKSLHSLAQSFTDTTQEGGDGLFEKYFLYNSVSQDMKTDCNSSCRRRHICAILHAGFEDFDACMSPDVCFERWHPHRHHHGYRPVPDHMFYIIPILVFIAVMLFMFVTLCCCRSSNSGLLFLPRRKYVVLNGDPD